VRLYLRPTKRRHNGRRDVSAKVAGDRTLDILWMDLDEREAALRQLVEEVLTENPPPSDPDAVVATYFLALRSKSLKQAADEIAYHATSGIHNPPAGTLLQECTGWAVGTIPFDSTGRIGLLRALAALGLAITRRTGHGGAGPTAAENARLEELALRILSVPAA